MLKQQIEQDLKAALLAGDQLTATTLRGLKSAILYAEVAKRKRDEGLDDQELIEVIAKEAKKRQESADLYMKGHDTDRAHTELKEKIMLEKYLPTQLTEEQLFIIIDKAIAEIGTTTSQAMGQVIGVVKSRTSGAADGSTIARLVRERLTQ